MLGRGMAALPSLTDILDEFELLDGEDPTGC